MKSEYERGKDEERERIVAIIKRHIDWVSQDFPGSKEKRASLSRLLDELNQELK